MKNKILKHLYNHLFEIRGQVPKLNILSTKLSKELYPSISKGLNQFTQTATLNDDVLMIHSIFFIFTHKPKISGNIELHKTISSNNMNIFTINIGYNENMSFDELNSIISHELHHYYDMMVRSDNKTPKSKEYHKILQFLTLDFTNNKIIKDFKHCFYLSFDHEINARTHELSTLLNNSNLKGDDLEKLFKNSRTYLDTLKLLNYDSSTLNDLSETDKKKLLNLFNGSGHFKYFNNINQLIQFFTKKFQDKGTKQLRKLSKIYTDKVSIKEIDGFFECYRYTKKYLDEMISLKYHNRL